MNKIADFVAADPIRMYIVTAVAAALLLLIIVRAVVRGRARIRRRQLDPYRITLQDIDRMEGMDFERYLYRLFVELGYDEVVQTQGSGDFGADLVFTDRSGARNVLQAKRYQADNRVGLGAVQEIYASMRYYRADKSIVLSSAVYTASCETLAGVNGVLLLDRDDLAALIADFKAGKHEQAMERIESEPRCIPSPWNKLSRPSRSAGQPERNTRKLRSR